MRGLGFLGGGRFLLRNVFWLLPLLFLMLLLLRSTADFVCGSAWRRAEQKWVRARGWRWTAQEQASSGNYGRVNTFSWVCCLCPIRGVRVCSLEAEKSVRRATSVFWLGDRNSLAAVLSRVCCCWAAGPMTAADDIAELSG